MTRIGVVGAGRFGQNHLRILSKREQARLVAVVDPEEGARTAAAKEYQCEGLASAAELVGRADAAVVATPTTTHAAVAVPLLEAGIDVLVEKPIAATREDAERIVAAAEANGRVLQVGHVERFNPAVEALSRAVTVPLFFEIHRMSLLSPRSLDVDVVLDLMIHDLDLVLALTGATPAEIRAAGISVLSDKVDLAHVRLAFANGCIANLTASRVSTEAVRKLRLFQPHQYFSLDYAKQDLFSVKVSADKQFGFAPLPFTKRDALEAEIEDFLACVETRRQPRVDGRAGMKALEVALDILAKIEEHGRQVAHTLSSSAGPQFPTTG